MNLRNLYWLREMEAETELPEVEMLRKARFDAQALVEITKSREIGVPTFVIGGLLIPLGLSLWRLASGTTREWWIALLAGAIGVAVGFLISWFVLRGAALASRRIRLSVTQPLAELWRTVGSCGSPPKPVAAVRSGRDLAHARCLDRPPAARDALARTLISRRERPPHVIRGQRTATGVPTSTKRYTRSASPSGRRTHPCDAGYDGTSGDWCIAIPPRKYAAYGIQTWKGTDQE